MIASTNLLPYDTDQLHYAWQFTEQAVVVVTGTTSKKVSLPFSPQVCMP